MFDDDDLVAIDDGFDNQEYELPPPPTRGIKQREIDELRNLATNTRKMLKVRGISVDSNGKWWFACSVQKSKTFEYLSHEEMKLKYPQFLVQYYETYLKLETEKPKQPGNDGGNA